MSYLKLDRTRIEYLGPSNIRGGVVISQVIDSYSRPEKPTLISSAEELDVYFGKSFTSREYFEELLSGNTTLLLTTPFKSSEEQPELDTSKYKEVYEISREGIDNEGNQVTVLIPITYTDQLPSTGEPNTKYYVSGEGEFYVYYLDEWVRVSDIPNKPSPDSNRDVLRLIDKNWGEENNLTWCWHNNSPKEILTIEEKESLLESIKDNNEEESYIGFTLDFSKINDNLKENPDSKWTYLVVPSSEDRKILFYIGEELSPNILNADESIEIPDTDLKSQIKIIKEVLEDNGWHCFNKDEEGLILGIYTRDILQDIQFYNIPGLNFYGDINITHDILSILSEEKKAIEFTSKIIGPNDEKINVEINKIKGKENWYRIIVSKYSHQEIYEGPINIEYDEDEGEFKSLEKMINHGSSLIQAKVYSDSLPEGSFILSRATQESNWTPEDYWRGLEKLREFNVSEDFFTVPEIDKFLINGVEQGNKWYSEYEKLLDYATEKNCQILISNYDYLFGCTSGMYVDDEPLQDLPEDPETNYMYFVKDDDWIKAMSWNGKSWITWGTSNPENLGRWMEIKETFSKSYTGNHIFNYTGDTSNRLVYFYKNIGLFGLHRPSWYVFLRGLIYGVYSMEISDIDYSSPAEFYTEDEKLGESLEKYKSNFLSYNGHVYYYRRFFSHPGDWKYETSILERFCLDKVSNTITRDFPYYLGRETSGEIINGLKKIIDGLKFQYPIIYSLDIDKFEEDQYEQSVSVYLILGIRETLDKDVKLSVTLNFNFI